VRSEILTAVLTRFQIFWNMMPHKLVNTNLVTYYISLLPCNYLPNI